MTKMTNRMAKIAKDIRNKFGEYLDEYKKVNGEESEIVWIKYSTGEIIAFGSSANAIKKHAPFIQKEI